MTTQKTRTIGDCQIPSKHRSKSVRTTESEKCLQNRAAAIGRNGVDRQNLSHLYLTDEEIPASTNAPSMADDHVSSTAFNDRQTFQAHGVVESTISVQADRRASQSADQNCCPILAGESLHESWISLRFEELVHLLRGMDASAGSKNQHSNPLLIAETTVREREHIKERINLLATTISPRKGRTVTIVIGHV